MLAKNHVLPIGSVISVSFNSDEGKNKIAVIIGHLTLRKDMISRYDYTCVEYPCGVENGLFYVNHEDVIEVIYRTPNQENLHTDWMEMKYAEFVAYYMVCRCYGALKDRFYYFFSKSGFTKELEGKSGEHVRLITLSDMYK